MNIATLQDHAVPILLVTSMLLSVASLCYNYTQGVNPAPNPKVPKTMSPALQFLHVLFTIATSPTFRADVFAVITAFEKVGADVLKAEVVPAPSPLVIPAAPQFNS